MKPPKNIKKEGNLEIPKKNLFPPNKPNSQQKENVSITSFSTTTTKGKSTKSFHRINEKNYHSSNNEPKPPLKFGLNGNIIIKDFLRKTEPKKIT